MKLTNAVADGAGWETTRSATHFKDAHVEVATVEVRSPARQLPHRWTVVHRKAAVVVAPLTAEGKLILVRQERIPIRAAIWEVPAGQIDEAWPLDSAAVEAVALREMREEIGYELGEGKELIPLGYFFSSPGFTDEHAYLFAALRVRRASVGPDIEETESILGTRAFTADEVGKLIGANEIRDANTLSIYARLCVRGLFAKAIAGGCA